MTVIERRRRRWVGPLLVVAVCAAGVAGSFGQSSASPASTVAASQVLAQAQARLAQAHDATAAQRRSKRLPDPKSLVSGVVALATAAHDGRAKVNLQVPAVDAVAYLDPAYRTPVTQTIPAPKYYLPRNPKPGCTYREAVIYSDLYAVHITQPDPKKDGVVTSVGRFPNAHVAALGFGSIPVTATLHTQQVKHNGKLVPIVANTATAFTSLPTQPSGLPCDPSWDAGARTPPLGTISHGDLDVRITDIRVDKQLVDVGHDCHTVTPLHLNLFGSPGYILYAGGQLIERYDPATVTAGGSVYPLHPGSTNLTIPAFAGCVNPKTGEDVSKLVTAMVSGRNNTVAVNQSTAVLNGINSKHVTLCLPGQGCVKRPVFVNPPKPGMTAHRTH